MAQLHEISTGRLLVETLCFVVWVSLGVVREFEFGRQDYREVSVVQYC